MDKAVRIAELKAEIAESKPLLATALDDIAQLKKNSHTNSNPPDASSGRGKRHPIKCTYPFFRVDGMGYDLRRDGRLVFEEER